MHGVDNPGDQGRRSSCSKPCELSSKADLIVITQTKCSPALYANLSQEIMRKSITTYLSSPNLFGDLSYYNPAKKKFLEI